MSDEEAEVIDLGEWVKQQEAAAQQHTEVELISLDRRKLEYLSRCRTMLFALVRREGRIRISNGEITGIPQRSRLDVKQDERGLVVTLVEK